MQFEISEQNPSSFGSVPFVILFSQILQKQLSGRLKIIEGNDVRLFKWRNGACYHSSSTIKNELPPFFAPNLVALSQPEAPTYMNHLKANASNHWKALSLLKNLSQDQLKNLRGAHIHFLFKKVFNKENLTAQWEPDFPEFDLPVLIEGTELIGEVMKNMDQNQIPKICGDLEPGAKVILNIDVKEVDLPPEEKGVLTVIKNNPKLEDIFESSFLESSQIYRHLISFWIQGLVDIRGANTAAREDLISKLSPAELENRNQIISVSQSTPNANFYELFRLSPDLSNHQIKTETQKMLEKFLAPSIENIFLPAEKNHLFNFLKKTKTGSNGFIQARNTCALP